MNIAETTAGSGAVLGLVVVILLQQLGLLPLSQLLPAVILVLVAVAVGAVLFGAVGWYADHH
jgi:uncharacterized membrane protein